MELEAELGELDSKTQRRGWRLGGVTNWVGAGPEDRAIRPCCGQPVRRPRRPGRWRPPGG